MTTINREHKDCLFRLIFADEKNKANTLALYNALNKSSYTNEDDLEITTIEEGILADFLKAHRSEVIEVYLSEVDEDILRERLMEEGEQRGFQNGFQNGQQTEQEANLQKLNDKIQRKIAKDKSLEQIAEELEEAIEDIRPLYEKLLKGDLD